MNWSQARVVARSDPAVLIAMLLSLGLYYLVPGLVPAVVGGGIFFALTLFRPAISLAFVPLAAPLFYRQRAFDLGERSLYFSLAEFVILTGVAAWVLRDGWSLVIRRSRPPALGSILSGLRARVGGTGYALLAFALVFLLIGVAWLFIPPGIIRNIALREFRVTVLEPVLFFLLMLRWIRTPSHIWRMAGTWLVAAALVSREAFEQYIFGEAALMEGVGRATSVLPSATALGIYLGKALPVAVTLAFLLPPAARYWRASAALLSVVIGLGLFATFARGAWIGVFVSLLVVALVARHRLMLAALGAALLAGLAALPFVNVTRITSMFDFSTEDNTGVARAKIWVAALRIIRDHPITGIGQDQFLYADPKYGVPQLRFFTTSHPHNFVLDFWLRLGLPGLLWLLAFLFYFGRSCLRLWGLLRGSALGALALALLASIVDFVVHGLLDMAYFTMDSALTFWLAAGLLASIDRARSLA